MWMQTGSSLGYKVRGLQVEKGDGWHITTWPSGHDTQGQVYWVKDGVFYKPSDKGPSRTEWPRASFGPIDTNVSAEEKDAVLNLIHGWDAQISPGGLREQE